jgi:chromosome segregation ATPase
VGELDRARTDGGAVLADADKALSAARPVFAELDDKVEKELAQAFQAIDKAIDDKRTEVEARRSELTKLQDDRDSAYRAWTERQTAYDTRTAELAGLPAAVKQQTVTLKALVAELATATTARNAVKACVVALEVEAAMARLKDGLGAAHEAELIGAIQDAGDDLAEARKKLTAAEAALGDKQAVVDDLATELDEVEKSRAADVRKLYDVPSANTPQPALAAQGA